MDFSRSLWCFGGGGVALVWGVDFCACPSGSEPCFLRDITLFSRHFWFFGNSRIWTWIFEISLVLWVQGRSPCTRRRLLRIPERKRALFCSCFKGHHYFPTILPSMLWVVDATYYVLWFYESFRVLLWGSVSMGTRGHKQPTLISTFRYFIKQNNISWKAVSLCLPSLSFTWCRYYHLLVVGHNKPVRRPTDTFFSLQHTSKIPGCHNLLPLLIAWPSY